jgi:hypothetical protein
MAIAFVEQLAVLGHRRARARGVPKVGSKEVRCAATGRQFIVFERGVVVVGEDGADIDARREARDAIAWRPFSGAARARSRGKLRCAPSRDLGALPRGGENRRGARGEARED